MVKKVLITGANGFLGQYMINAFEGCKVYTLGRGNHDISVESIHKELPSLPCVDIVVHCLGKAHSIPKNDEEKEEFFKVNVTGTENLLKKLNECSKKVNSFVFISSVSVYGLEEGIDISEETPLMASDAYGRSKIEAEKVVQQWGNDNDINVLILRLPLVVGKKPPGNLGKMIEAISRGYYFRVGKGDNRRSMVLAEDVAKLVYSSESKAGVYNLTDGIHPMLNELDTKIMFLHNGNHKVRKMPIFILNTLAKLGDLIENYTLIKVPFNTRKLKKLSSSLIFSDSRARTQLGWTPNSVLDFYSQK